MTLLLVLLLAVAGALTAAGLVLVARPDLGRRFGGRTGPGRGSSAGVNPALWGGVFGAGGDGGGGGGGDGGGCS